MTSPKNNSRTQTGMPLPEMGLPCVSPHESREQRSKRIAEQEERIRNMPRFKESPRLLEPHRQLSAAERELVNQRLVESYSSNPLYQQAAKESGNEAEYWRQFSISMGVHTLRGFNDSTPEVQQEPREE